MEDTILKSKQTTNWASMEDTILNADLVADDIMACQ